jgi:hypothetical protein
LTDRRKSWRAVLVAMKRHWVEFTGEWTHGPMTFWVHAPSQDDPAKLNPPAPPRISGKGFPVYYVEVDGFTFPFASLDEIRVCIDVLGEKLLPNTLRLAQDRGGDPDQHWLRKMPDETKPWRYRQKAVKYLEKALREFEKQLGQ